MDSHYSNRDVTVEEQHTLQINGNTWRVSLCAEPFDEEAQRFYDSLPERMKAVTVPREHHKFIGIEVLDKAGNVVDKMDLRYQQTAADQLPLDWEKLVKQDVQHTLDLTGWHIKFNHRTGMGYFRSGGTIIYN